MNELIEALAEVEHVQWMHWLAKDVPEAIREKWQRSWIDYAELPEDLKEADRVWARKVVSLLREHKLVP